MSNNPHSHINQPAQNSWNPLQIPSYIPRQPQLAHMSNERPMVRSPLAWPPAAPPPDTLYNFMSAANHKNLEHSMNPLLPPFVRGPPPFDSMDLSLQRSAGSPLNKSAHSLLPVPPTQLDYGLKLQHQQHNLQQQQQAQQQLHAQNNYPIHNLSTNSPQTQQHSNSGLPNVSTATASSTPSSPAQNTAKFMSSNGSDCSEQPTSLIQPNQNLGSNNGNNYMRENYGKMTSSHINRTFDNDPHSKSLQKPVELVNKDCNYSGMMPNKMSTTHLQQQSSKKHSPLRGSTSTVYHVSQQQQQQQQSPFNSPANTIKHNGPHTPPNPPQSPNMHSTQQQQQQTTNTGNTNAQQQQAMLHGGNNNANLLDYNQLHMQQHNNYTPTTHLQQQHLHHVYSPHQQQQHHHHQQHWQQQQQQHMQQHSPMQPPPFNSPLHPQPQAQQTTLTNLEPASPATPSYTINTESNFEQRTNLEQHPTAAAPPTHSPSNRLTQNIPDSAESPTTNASSNDDDSNNGDRDKPIAAQTTPNKFKKNSSNSPVNSSSSNKEWTDQNKTIGVSPIRGQSKSPRNSPAVHQRKSPRKAETNSPESLDLSSKHATSPVSVAATSPGHTLTPPHQPTQPSSMTLNDDDTVSQSPIIETEEKLKNGHTPPPIITSKINEDPTANDEVETIDKIAEMIAKTTSNSSNSQHSHHSHCSNSNDAHSNASNTSTTPHQTVCESPKTKKQRQALKLRNAEHGAPTVTAAATDWSTNSYNEAAIGVDNTTIVTAKTITTTNISSVLVGNDNDNAVLAEELRKETITPQQHSTQLVSTLMTGLSPHKQPLSPQSNSRSSSSSSTSSSGSNSSHSSFGNPSQKSKSIDLNAPKTKLSEQTCVEDIKNQENTATELPLNLNSRMNTIASEPGPASTSKQPAIPDKATFEEVENKLEEMFAGIEDETPPLIIDKQQIDLATTETNAIEATNLSVALELSNSLSDMTTPAAAIATIKTTINSSVAVSVPVPIQTKAAKKSTVPSPIKPTIPTSATTPIPRPASAQSKTGSKDTYDAPSPTPLRKNLPRRRQSMALDPANLRIMFEDNEKESPKYTKEKEETNKDVVVILDDEQPSTSAAAAAAALANASNDDPNKQVKNRNNTNSQNNNNNKGKSNAITNSNKSRTGTAANTTNTAASSTNANKMSPAKTTSKRSKSNQRKQVQQKRRKNSSSEDELTTAGAREQIASTTGTTTTSATINIEKYKSPFILIKRDGSVSVVNAATAEDINADKQTKSKKPPTSYAHHSQQRRNIRGFHSSTLSQKYDAETTDSSWICVFCKRGPHRGGLGDLFGPYLVTINCEEYKNAINAPDAQNLDEEFVNKRRRVDMVQCNPRGPPVVMATKAQEAIANAISGGNRMNKKKKKSIDEQPQLSTPTFNDPLDVTNETFFGMNKVAENNYEVWLHEDCSVWAPDVYLVGARIMGLDAAVWNSTRYQCILCEKSGATICCLQRDCKAAAHTPCAREANWNLNENDLHVHCQAHAKNTNTKNTDIKQNTNQSQNTTNS